MKKIIGFLIFSCLFANSYAVPALSNNDYRLIMSSQNMQNEKEVLNLMLLKLWNIGK